MIARRLNAQRPRVTVRLPQTVARIELTGGCPTGEVLFAEFVLASDLDIFAAHTIDARLTLFSFGPLNYESSTGTPGLGNDARENSLRTFVYGGVDKEGNRRDYRLTRIRLVLPCALVASDPLEYALGARPSYPESGNVTVDGTLKEQMWINIKLVNAAGTLTADTRLSDQSGAWSLSPGNGGRLLEGVPIGFDTTVDFLAVAGDRTVTAGTQVVFQPYEYSAVGGNAWQGNTGHPSTAAPDVVMAPVTAMLYGVPIC